MISLDIPGYGQLTLTMVVCDYNGTLARDGVLLDHLYQVLPRVAQKLTIHVVTGDTFGTAHAQLRGLPCELTVLPAEGQAEAKAAWVQRLGADQVVAIGNGRNDARMLEVAALGVGVVGDEGLAGEAARASDVIARHIVDAFELLLKPQRLVATLRS